MKTLSLLATAAALAASTAAGAVTVPLNITFNTGGDVIPGFYTVSNDFTLPTGFTNAVLSITAFTIDDRGVLQLNGTIVDNAGIFGPGDGLLRLTANGTDDAYTYTRGNGARSVSITSGFVTGLNSFRAVVNDTNNGIYSPTRAGAALSSVSVTAELNYDVAAGVPEPATWAMLILGFGLVGAAARRRRAIVAA